MKQDLTQRDRTTDLGVVHISNDVIASIASIAAMETKGVHKTGGGFGRTLADFLTKRTGTYGVKIRMTNTDVKLTISIIVDYGVDIPRIADEVQEKVKTAVEQMTGLVLSEVDVVVEGVHGKASAEGR